MVHKSDHVIQLMSLLKPYSESLEMLLIGLSEYKEELSQAGRNFDEFVGHERRFASNLRTPLKNLLNKNISLKHLDVECEFKKHGADYAQLCGCNDPEVIKRFVEKLKEDVEDDNVRDDDNQASDIFYPDIIYHLPGNMEWQICCVEIKIKRDDNNSLIYQDLRKLTNIKQACGYLKGYLAEGSNPVFCFHVFLLLRQSLREIINHAQKRTIEKLKKYNQDIICIYEEDDDFYCCTLGELLA